MNSAQTGPCATLSYVATPQLTELQRLILQIERDLVAQAQLRTALTAGDETVADDRQELRVIKARMKRKRLGYGLRAQR